MSRVIVILLLAAGLASFVAWRLHGRTQTTPVDESARRDSGISRFEGNAARHSGNDSACRPLISDSSSETDRRGLRLLAADEAAREGRPSEPHPWAEYMRKRAATWAAWQTPKLDVHIDHAKIGDFPGYFAPAGLTLRIDPAVELTHEYDVEFHQKFALEILLTATADDPVRLAIGTDGALWLVPRKGRAACEPEFIGDLRKWEFAVRKTFYRPGSPLDAPDGPLRTALAEKHDVHIVRVRVPDALAILQRIFGVTFDLDPEYPAEDPGARDRPAVSVIRDNVRLEDALKDLLESQDLVAVPGSFTVHIVPKDVWIRRAKADAAAKEEQELAARGAEELRNRVVHLDGRPLSAGDLATVVTAQLGLHLKLDPLLGDGPARWEAVDVELKLGEVLDAIAAGAKCRCDLHPDAWPRSDMLSAGWTLWVVTESSGVR